MRRRRIAVLAVLVLVLVTGCGRNWPGGGHGGGGQGQPRPEHPVVFVHGGAGSGAQFESQGLRFTSNGYPADWVGVHEYDSTFGINTMEQVWAGLDQTIADILAETGADQVDLAGHSLGTSVLQGYLTSSPERAAVAAHYVNIDGRTAPAPPGGVPTLAVWGMGDPARQIVGARNHADPTQSHVQVATSAETFGVMYEFLNGRAPHTTDIVPEPPGRVEISGRANLFPSNQGAPSVTLQLWRVDPETGHRVDDEPEATEAVAADGSWGPLRVNGRHHYELALTRADGSSHHFYASPFVRSDHLVRLLTSEPGTGIDLLRAQSDAHTSLTITRNKEIWGDQGAAGDSLVVAGAELATPALAPQDQARERSVRLRRRHRRGDRPLAAVAADLRPAVPERRRPVPCRRPCRPTGRSASSRWPVRAPASPRSSTCPTGRRRPITSASPCATGRRRTTPSPGGAESRPSTRPVCVAPRGGAGPDGSSGGRYGPAVASRRAGGDPGGHCSRRTTAGRDRDDDPRLAARLPPGAPTRARGAERAS